MTCCLVCEDTLDLWDRGERNPTRLLAVSGLTPAAWERRLRLHGHTGTPLGRFAAAWRYQ